MIHADPEIISAVEDMIYVLNDAPEELILKYSGEVSPLDIDFVYIPREVPAEIDFTPEKIEEKQKEKIKQILNKSPNYVCGDCSEKMYPVKKYLRPGNKPVLVLHYNGPVGNKPKPDRSDRHIFGNEDEDELFARMCGAANFSIHDLFFQEFPACHFASNSDSEAEWKKRTDNCLRHVIHTIKENKIKFLIFTGVSAQFYLGKKRAREHFEGMTIFDPEIEGVSIRAVILRSPGALLALEKKRKAAKDAEHAVLLEEEKEIKTLILNALKKIADELK